VYGATEVGCDAAFVALQCCDAAASCFLLLLQVYGAAEIGCDAAFVALRWRDAAATCCLLLSQVYEAAEIGHIHQHLTRFPHGYNTRVGEYVAVDCRKLCFVFAAAAVASNTSRASHMATTRVLVSACWKFAMHGMHQLVTRLRA
jgi:hypothetical protein